MAAVTQKILVVGGNGFIGSAVCKAALTRGFQVISVSSSGQPFRTPKGHTPAWTAKVDWQTGDAFRPESFAHLFAGVGAVVHTLGTLLEDGGVYKRALRNGDVLGALASFARTITPGGSNPLTSSGSEAGSYARLNRDAAIRVAEAFVASSASAEADPSTTPRAFLYISAEDIFQPVIPAGYIESKRDAERALTRMFSARQDYRGVYLRPSLVYHPHLRPYTTPIAALLDLSATVHAKVPAGVPTPSGVLRALGTREGGSDGRRDVRGSALESLANALTLPPIHVDHVAEACCIAADRARSDVEGVYGVRAMRELIGWTEKGAERRMGVDCE